jgi:hypothetical protein
MVEISDSRTSSADRSGSRLVEMATAIVAATDQHAAQRGAHLGEGDLYFLTGAFWLSA